MSLILALLVAWEFAIGTYLLLQRQVTRVILGLALLTHGAVLLLQVMGGRAGKVPLLGPGDSAEGIAAPLPQAFALTAIVIGFASTSFLLAMAYRAWLGTGDDKVRDDLEDRRIARQVTDTEGRFRGESALDDEPGRDDDPGDDDPGDDGVEEVHDP